MAKILIAALMAAVLSGCAGVNYVLENYQGVTPVQVSASSDTYRIFEHPRINTLMVTPSIAISGGQGMVQGITLGAFSPRTPKPLFENAVRGYLDATSRKHCQITDGYVILDPQWEFRFTCTPAKAGKEPFTPFPQESSGS